MGGSEGVCAGQERYRVLSRAYLRGCQAAVVVCDVTRPDTLEQVISVGIYIVVAVEVICIVVVVYHSHIQT